MPTSETQDSTGHWKCPRTWTPESSWKKVLLEASMALFFSTDQNTPWKRKACSSPFTQKLLPLMHMMDWELGHQSVFCNISAQLKNVATCLQWQTSSNGKIHYYVFPLGEDEAKHNEVILRNERWGTMVIFFLWHFSCNFQGWLLP